MKCKNEKLTSSRMKLKIKIMKKETFFFYLKKDLNSQMTKLIIKSNNKLDVVFTRN